MTGEEILIRMPGTGVTVDYADQRERDRSVRLAEARQRIAERTGYIPAWDELSEELQEGAVLEARNWLRAAADAGLLADEGTPQVTEYTWAHNDYIASSDATTDRAQAAGNARTCRQANPADSHTVAVVRRRATEWELDQQM